MVYSYRTSPSASLADNVSEEHETNTLGCVEFRKMTHKYRPGACVQCKSLKVRCEFDLGSQKCQRCLAGGHECQPRTRKKRKTAPTHEDLQHRSHQQDLEIGNLLQQLREIKESKQIREWLARAQLDSGSDSTSSELGHKEPFSMGGPSTDPELAACGYFLGGEISWRDLTPPPIVKHCRLFPEEINHLFSIFFSRVNPYFSLFDPELHTPAKLIWTSPFLFTVICAVSARYYTQRQLYSLAMDFARDGAGKALVESVKDIDTCQAYLLLAVYPEPKKKWAEDRSWLLMGVAIRMALELGLNQPPPKVTGEREALNRTRTWLNCYCVDGSHATQFGKIPLLPLDDYVAGHCREWYQSSPLNLPFDVHLVAYVEITRLMAEYRSKREKCISESAISAALDLDRKLSELMAYWSLRYATAPYAQDPMCAYRADTTSLITAYLRLVVLSSAFQSAVHSGLRPDSPVVEKSIKAAYSVINIMINRLYLTEYLRYAMNSNFLYVAFAAAFLINLMRPKFIHLLSDSQHQEAVFLVERLTTVLCSEHVALDGRHTPALYSRFLSSLLAKHNTRPSYPESQAPPNVCLWPDTYPTQTSISDSQDDTFNSLPYRTQNPELNVQIDLSIQHFMNVVNPQPTSLLSLDETLGGWDVYNMFPGMPEEFLRAQQSEQYAELWRSLSPGSAVGF